MDEIVKAVTSQLAGAVAVLVPALVALAVTWINSRKAHLETMRQAALGAVCEVEAATKAPIALDGVQKKELAMERVAARLPGTVKLDPAKLDKLVQEAWERERRERTSIAPDERPTTPLPPPPRMPSDPINRPVDTSDIDKSS